MRLGRTRVGIGRRLAGPAGGSHVSLSADSIGEGAASALLVAIHPLSGSGAGEGAAAAALSLLQTLSGAGSGEAPAVASLVAIHPLSSSGVGEGAGSASLTGIIGLAATGVGEGVASAYATHLHTAVSGTSVGEGDLAAHLSLVWRLAGSGVGEGAASGGVITPVLLLVGTSVGESDVAGTLKQFQQLSGTGVGEGLVSVQLGARFPLAGSGVGEGVSAGGVLRGIHPIGGALSVGEGAHTALIGIARIVAEDTLFYLDSRRGFVPTTRATPVFTRSTKAPAFDAAGRPYDVLPDTPRFAWARVGGRVRPLLHLQPGRTVNGVTYAADLAHWDAALPAADLALYVRFLPDFASGAAGVLAAVGATSGAAPHLRLRHSGGSYLGQLHNGTTGVEIGAPVRSSQGQETELMVLVLGGTLEFLQAVGGQVTDHVTAAAPALPAGWSAQQVVLNGHSSAPSDARYAEVKLVKSAAIVRTGAARMAEVRDFLLNPMGEVA